MINTFKFDVWHFSHLLFDILHRQITRHHSRHSLTIAHDHSSFLKIFTYDRSSSLDALATIVHRRSTYLSRSLIVARRTRHDRSSSLDALVTIAHRRSTHSSWSFTITREFHSQSLDVINDRSALIEVVKNKLIEAREDFKKKILSRFQTKDLLVRFVSTRYKSRHSSILRFRFSIYILQHVSSHNITSILVHSTHTSIYSLFILIPWQ